MLGAHWTEAGSLFGTVSLSVLSSWAVAAYFFRKETRAEKIADQIRYGLQRALLPIIYPQFFDPEKSIVVRPHQKPPRNTDTPYVELAVFNERHFHPNQTVEMLIKLIDTGLDLDNPDGVTVRDHRGNEWGVVAIGLGYCKVKFHIPSDALAGPYDMTVKLADLGEHTKSGPNHNVQTLPMVIERGS